MRVFCIFIAILTLIQYLRISHIDNHGVRLDRIEATDGGPNSLLRTTEIGTSVDKAFEFFDDQERIKSINDKMIKSDVIHQFNPTSKLLRREMKGNLVVSNRDMSLFSNEISMTDGSKALVIFSVENELIPETKCVRAFVDYMITIIKEITSDS